MIRSSRRATLPIRALPPATLGPPALPGGISTSTSSRGSSRFTL